MKKIAVLLLFCVCFVACKKEEPYPKELDFNQMFDFIGSSKDKVHKEFEGLFDRDTIYTAPFREEFYNLVTQEKIYYVVLSFRDGVSLDKFTASAKESYSTKENAVSFAKKLSDRAYSASSKWIRPDTYHAEYVISSAIRNYDSRDEFWSSSSITNSERLNEYWIFDKSENISIRFEIKLDFDGDFYKISLYGQLI